MTKFDCPGCGRHFTLCANNAVTNDFRRWWEAEHACCEPAYHAALALVDWLEPRPDQNRDNRICGRLCRTLDEAVRALLEAGSVRH